jgi:hypothetical protein
MRAGKTQEDVGKAVALIRSSPGSDDKEIYRNLVADGIGRERAARLVEFIPTAYARLVLEKAGARLSPMFQRRLADGSMSPERPLSGEAVWNEVAAFALAEVATGLSREHLFLVAGRSAEFGAANQLLQQGSKLENMAFTALGFPWPESGPEIP